MRRITWIGSSALAVVMLLGAIFFYLTDWGHSLRTMIAGSILTSQHPQYARFVLNQAEIEEMRQVLNELPSVQSATYFQQQKLNRPLIEMETLETQHYLAKIMKVSDPRTIHLVPTRLQNKGQPLSDLIKNNGAIAGINAGGFADEGGTGSGGQMIGIVIGDGVVYTDENRNRKMLVCGFTRAGQMITGNYSIQELLERGVTQAVSFGPQLIVDGESMVTPQINSAYGWAPRTAIGQTADGTVIMIITDGRFYHDKRHRGASMSDLQEMFQKYGAVQAFALDGGGSTTMIYNGELQMQPATQTAVGMRYLPNAFVVIPPDQPITNGGH